MYLLTATLTEDLIGCTIHVQALEAKGRRHKVLDEQTWLVTVPAGIDEQRHAEIRRILDRAVSDLSQNLRRVFPGVSPQEEQG